MSDTQWFRFKFTAPPKQGYVEGEDEDDVREMMDTSHPIFAGYNNGANHVTISPLPFDTAKIEEYVLSPFKHNIAIEADGTIIRPDGLNSVKRQQDYNGRPVVNPND